MHKLYGGRIGLRVHQPLESILIRVPGRPAVTVAAGVFVLLSALAWPAVAQSAEDDLDFLTEEEPKAQTAPASAPPEKSVAAAEPYPEVIPVAQPASPAPAPVEAPRRSRQIEEIVVTAQKRESSIQDAPFAISALSGEDAEFRAVGSAADLQFQVPGLNVSEASSATLISIRGVGSNVDSGATEPAVAVHIDGVYQPRPSTGPLGLNDLDRVEVLKGPQGTLYGRNATGGVVNYLLKKPTNEFEGLFKLGLGNYDKRSAVGIVSGPLVGDVLKGRLLAEWDEDGGWVEDETSGTISDDRSGYGGRVALSWLPLEPLSVDLSVLYRYDDGAGVTPRDVCLAPPDPEIERNQGVVPPTNPEDCLQGEPHKRKISHLPYGERDTLNAALSAVWDFGDINLKSVTGYQDHEYLISYDVDSLARDILYVAPKHDTSKALSEELSAFGTWGDLQWLAGGYYFDGEYTPDLKVEVPAVAGGLNVFLKEVGTTKAVAVFTDLTYALTDSIRVGGGVRLLRDKKHALQTNQYEALGGAVPFPGTVPGVLAECENAPVSLEFKEMTPKFNAQWDALDSATLYANYAVGFQSGGTNFSSCGDTYDPEENTSVEVGLKSNWFERRLVVNAALFQTDYKNFQIMKTEGFAANVINAPKAQIRGGEVELTALLTDQLVFNAAVSMLDAHFEEFCDQDPAVPDDQEPQDCPTGEGGRNLAGVQLSRSPDYTINLGAEYSWELPLQFAQHLRVRGEWFKTADQIYRPFGSPHDGQEGYTIVNAFLSLARTDERLELRLFGKNLQDTEYFLYKIANSFGQRYGTAGEPRRFGAEVVVRF